MTTNNRALVFYVLYHKVSERSDRSLVFWPEAADDEDKNNQVSNNGSGSNDLSKGQLAVPPSLPPPPDGLEEVKAALLAAVEEFELHYKQNFGNLSSQLPANTGATYVSLERVMDEILYCGINWGRVVGLFALGRALCQEYVDKEMNHMVPNVAEWMTLYLDDYVEPWIQSNGGWRHFAKTFQSNAAAEVRRIQDSLKRWLLVGVVVLTGVLLGARIAKKYL